MSTGYLEPLTIRGFKTDENFDTAKPLSTFTAMFNPEKYAITDTINYDLSQGHGNKGSQPRFLGIQAREMKFELFIDGTGASGTAKLKQNQQDGTFQQKEVIDEIELFKAATGYKEESNRNTVCFVSWGTLTFVCVLTQAVFNFTLFRPNGTPLRAVIDATFKEHTNAKLQQLIKRVTARKLTKIPPLTGGDSLPLLSFQVYNNPQHCVAVAQVNNLNTIMNVEPNREIVFPPINQKSQS